MFKSNLSLIDGNIGMWLKKIVKDRFQHIKTVEYEMTGILYGSSSKIAKTWSIVYMSLSFTLHITRL